MTEQSCAAAVPRRNVIGGHSIFRLVRHYWAECGQPATAVHEYRCAHGHVVRKPTCTEHWPVPGLVGCRQCFDQGHDCPMQVSQC